MTTCKPYAEGYVNDCEKLLEEFKSLQSVEFSDFAKVFKNLHFSCIYLGRQGKELIEFTNEIFQQTLVHILDDLVIVKIGAVYTLYALYRNQTSIPPIRIRVTIPQYVMLQNILNHARSHNIASLQYVICYLMENAFDFVAQTTLYGPHTHIPMITEVPSEASLNEMKEIKGHLREFQKSFSLQELKKLTSRYIDAAKDVLHSKDQFFKNNEHFLENCTDLTLKLDNLLHSNRAKNERVFFIESKEVNNEVGSRRSTLRSSAFAKKMVNIWNQSLVDSEEKELSEQSPKKRRVMKRRKPDRKKKLGRPRKDVIETDSSSSEDEVDEPQFELEKFKKRQRGPTQRKSYIDDYH